VVVPVHDQNPVRRTPWVTYLLIAANIVVFLLTPAASTTGVQSASLGEVCRQEAFYQRYGAVPRELVDNRPLATAPTGQVGVGPGGPGCVVEPRRYEKVPLLSVLTSMFLHGGWLHLLGNMLFLWVFGNNVEERFRRLRFLLFYLAGGYVAAYGFALANPDLTQPIVGASGAISAVLGAYLVLYPRVPVWSLVPVLLFIPLRLPAWFVLGLWFVVQWLYSTGFATSGTGTVAYLAHVLGFVFGALVAVPLRGRRGPAPVRYPHPYPYPYPRWGRRGRGPRPGRW